MHWVYFYQGRSLVDRPVSLLGTFFFFVYLLFIMILMLHFDYIHGKKLLLVTQSLFACRFRTERTFSFWKNEPQILYFHQNGSGCSTHYCQRGRHTHTDI